MTQPFNADEVFEIAEQVERNGAKFYRRAAEFVLGDKARELLNKLAEMEERHEKTFAAMRAEVAKKRPDWSADAADVDGAKEATLYLRALAEGRVFNLRADPSEALSGSESIESILKTAIGLEKDAIIFYLGIKDAVPPELGRDKVDEIIREEMTHITILTWEIAALEGTK